MPQPLLQLIDLSGQSLWRGVQLLAGPHHTARLGGCPEVTQMFEVHGMALFIEKTEVF
jgi:hypothetical protein